MPIDDQQDFTPEPLYIPDETFRVLIDEQFPHLAERELGRRYTLEDHFAIRIGDDFGALFPRYGDRDGLYERASHLIMPLADAWTFPSSHPIATGDPGHGYPHHWVLVEWVSASTAGFVPLHEDSAVPLAHALHEIHVPAPASAPANPHTGVALPKMADKFEQLLANAARSGAPEQREIDVDATRNRFHQGACAPMDVTPTWTHGRLEPRAVLSDRGRFAGILLWHNFGAGDPAADLGCAANLLPLEVRDDFFNSYGDLSCATATRVNAFQVFFALNWVAIDDPFVMRMAWERLIELDLASEA